MPVEFKKELNPIFQDPKRIIFYVNAIFDGCISHFDGINFGQRIVDCGALARVEYNGHRDKGGREESYLSMAYLAEYYGVQQKIDKVKEYIKEHELYSPERCRFTGKRIGLYNKVPLDLMFEYGCGDARTTFDLGTKIIQCINYKDQKYISQRGDAPPMIEVAKNEIELTSVLLDMKIKGFRVWNNYIEKAIVHEKTISEKLHREVEQLTGGINLNSGKQVAEYLVSKGVEVPRKEPTDHAWKMYDNWLKKAEIAKEKGKEKQYIQAMQKAEDYRLGNYITDKTTLNRLMEKYPDLDFLSKVTGAKQADKKISTYYSNFKKLQDENGYIHAALNQEAAITGRLSSSEPNLQNLHKEKWDGNPDSFLIRKSFIADPGCRLIFGDYSQQEMIYMLDQAGELSVINKLLSGEVDDFYLATAHILKESLDVVIERAEAKAMALGLAYGKGLELLAKELGYIDHNSTAEEIEAGKKKASKFKNEFFAALGKLKKLQKRLENQVKWYGKIHNPFGRVAYFNEQQAYKALNSFVQGGSADITKRALVGIWKRYKRENLKSRLLLTVHDEIITNCVPGEEELVMKIMREEMVRAYPHKHIPLSVDFEISEINSAGVSPWGEKKEIE